MIKHFNNQSTIVPSCFLISIVLVYRLSTAFYTMKASFCQDDVYCELVLFISFLSTITGIRYYRRGEVVEEPEWEHSGHQQGTNTLLTIQFEETESVRNPATRRKTFFFSFQQRLTDWATEALFSLRKLHYHTTWC